MWAGCSSSCLLCLSVVEFHVSDAIPFCMFSQTMPNRKCTCAKWSRRFLHLSTDVLTPTGAGALIYANITVFVHTSTQICDASCLHQLLQRTNASTRNSRAIPSRHAALTGDSTRSTKGGPRNRREVGYIWSRKRSGARQNRRRRGMAASQ